MDGKLISWARAVKRRRRAGHPTLWLFADPRGPDPLAFAAAAPPGLCGIVLRPDALRDSGGPGSGPGSGPGWAALARLCRARRVALSVAADWRLARQLGAGLHLRDGRKPVGAQARGWAVLTSSAHDAASLRRARAAGALAFLSPAFPTASHPDRAALLPARWSRLAGKNGGKVAALGGIGAGDPRRLPGAVAAGAVDALRPYGRAGCGAEGGVSATVFQQRHG
jgi:thiamine-phosphate pyrophosphorylase